MWTAERVVSLAQLPICVVPFVVTTPLTDAIFCTLAILHSHWGIEVRDCRIRSKIEDTSFQNR